ncbi:methionyl-tRNA formyltransferase Fmt [Gottschalkia acidurici 9a]|uniref:Methionyl-tRNA formyltransferase n=1 Tax=Gottschalkia acidurici (strain ATCC 7906 / DSM 604 / BCRC 14475 / CIP 104303 / KCTC 5404 / NCIMB 10678 / 9a) TaxID=1128398 RepID=K0B1Y1_GOTA9|nr:methionyl-tRNA formyltransferase [Gottschalkia acidurici]AFS78691.1 methionyl-tRNA formyltransferase Fmt [Gottschalkia acidurici 9a]
MKAIFMGTPDFAVPTLEALNKEHEVSLVITQPDKPKGRGKLLSPPPVKEKAMELGIEVYQPKDINTEESIAKIREISPDIIVVVAYGQLLKEDILNLPKYKCVNVHASLLPKYRGAAPINWVVINGEEKTGVTIMEMSKGLDAGDMISKRELLIDSNMTAGELHDKLMYIGSELLAETLKEIENGTAIKEPQDHSLSTYAHMMDKSLGKIDWNKKGIEIKNLIRGTQPWPSSYFQYENKNIKVLDAEVVDKFKDGENGKVVEVSEKGIAVNVNDSCLILKKIQFPGKKPMTIEEFLRGNEFKTDITLR